MGKIKSFSQFKTDKWIGPLTILNIKGNTVYTNFGNFVNTSQSKLTVGYSYLLRVDNNEIIDTGMSCVDLVILVDTGYNYKILSIERGKEPFKGMYANPGGNIDEGEKPIDAAVRELEEETNLSLDPSHFHFIGAFDKPYRDPRNKNCVSFAFAVVLDKIPAVKPGDDATKCVWNDVSYDGDIEVEMAFDHAEIIKKTIQILHNTN